VAAPTSVQNVRAQVPQGQAIVRSLVAQPKKPAAMANMRAIAVKRLMGSPSKASTGLRIGTFSGHGQVSPIRTLNLLGACGVDRGAGDRAMPQPPLDRPGIVPLFGERIAAGVARWDLSSRPASAAARSIMRAKPAVVKGEPRSLTPRRLTLGSPVAAGVGRASHRLGWGGCSASRSCTAPAKSTYPMPCADFFGRAAEPTGTIERWSS
jgi:hypothetical protein